MGGGVGVGGGGADENRGGVSGIVRERSAVPVGARGGGSAGGWAGGDEGVSRWPQVTQKRRPRWLALPQSGQGLVAAGGGGAVGAPPRRPKITSGAEGRCATRLGAGVRPGSAGAGCGVCGAVVVAASGDVGGGYAWPSGADRPTGGVGAATRGASL
jgi:hypothetical protein